MKMIFKLTPEHCPSLLMSSRKAYKACASKNQYVLACKRYGWHDRYCGNALVDMKTGNPIASITKLFQCSRECCDAVEESVKTFMHCGNCLTVYCSRECQKADWKDHKSFCLSSESYNSQLNQWECKLDRNVLWTSKYVDEWEKWIATDKMQKLLKSIGKTPDDFRPSS